MGINFAGLLDELAARAGAINNAQQVTTAGCSIVKSISVPLCPTQMEKVPAHLNLPQTLG